MTTFSVLIAIDLATMDVCEHIEAQQPAPGAMAGQKEQALLQVVGLQVVAQSHASSSRPFDEGVDHWLGIGPALYVTQTCDASLNEK